MILTIKFILIKLKRPLFNFQILIVFNGLKVNNFKIYNL